MTKPCRAASSSMFTTNIDLWCFSFVTLFNLQGTRPSASAAERTLSYHVVRLLSSTFFNFFEVFSALVAAFRRSLRQLIYFTRAFRVCQALFSLLSKFFRSRHWLDRRVSDSLLTLPDHPQFVKYFYSRISFGYLLYFQQRKCAILQFFYFLPRLPFEHQSRASLCLLHVKNPFFRCRFIRYELQDQVSTFSL